MVDNEQFILEVKRRPVLWDTNHADYNQRHSKLSAWEEVGANIYVDWIDLSNYDKFGRVRDLQNRWKNIRDSYMKELKYERKVEKGLALAKKNRYRYAYLLDFLNSGEKRKTKESDQSSSEIDDSPQKKGELKPVVINLSESMNHVESSPAGYNNQNNQMKVNGNRRAKRFKSNSNHSTSLNLQSDSSTLDSDSNNHTINRDTSREKQNNLSTVATPQQNCSVEVERVQNHSLTSSQCFQDYYNSEMTKVHSDYLSPSVEIHSGFSSLPLDQDDDKMFLLSLAPYFKKLNEERKLQARIEMSTLLQKMIYKKC